MCHGNPKFFSSSFFTHTCMREFDAVYAELMAFQLFSRTRVIQVFPAFFLSIFEQCSERYWTCAKHFKCSQGAQRFMLAVTLWLSFYISPTVYLESCTDINLCFLHCSHKIKWFIPFHVCLKWLVEKEPYWAIRQIISAIIASRAGNIWMCWHTKEWEFQLSWTNKHWQNFHFYWISMCF